MVNIGSDLDGFHFYVKFRLYKHQAENMYEPREKVFWLAITSHVGILILQFIFNILCPDHNANVFQSPKDPNENISIGDKFIDIAFSGLTRWDAQYFIHIAKYGYTYENTLAFFPLFPMLIRFLANGLRFMVPFLNYSSLIVISGIVISFICFVKSTLILFDLTKVIFKDEHVAYRSAVFYCINPARIFHTAIYTESTFAYLTFHCMLASANYDPCMFLSSGLSTLVRSNGLVNAGFALYAWIRDFLINTVPNFMMEYKYYRGSSLIMLFNLRHIFISISQILLIMTLSLLPYCLLQVYNYTKFCMIDLFTSFGIPPHIKDYANENNLFLPNYQNFSWCQSSVPMSYAHVQKEYWNVGFMKYYQLKQLPNFLLAFPILYFVTRCCAEFLREHKSKFFTLEFFIPVFKKDKLIQQKYPSEMFVFIVHGLFLTLVCVFYLHIQISTRFLCSASPLIYWYCSLETLSNYNKFSENYKKMPYENKFNMKSKWKIFPLSQKKFSLREKIMYGYFLGYNILGCFMFSNFLPWT